MSEPVSRKKQIAAFTPYEAKLADLYLPSRGETTFIEQVLHNVKFALPTKAVKKLNDEVVKKFAAQIIFDALVKTPYRVFLPDAKDTHKDYHSSSYLVHVVNALA